MAPRRGYRELSGIVSPSHPRPPVDPALLNAGAGDAMWTNLGDWHDATDYVQAAAALARRVGAAAALGAERVVVDYACGYGDSLRLWVEHFGVRRAIGVEPDPAVCAVVQARIARWGLSDRLRIVQGRAEDTAPRHVDAEANAVVCVDAAYHFRSRLRWWQMVVRDLPAGAGIACSDVLLADGQRVSLTLLGLATAMRIPGENLVDATWLGATLSALGVQGITQESLGHAVLDGFVARAPMRGLALRVTRAGIRTLRQRALVDYALIAGTVGAA